MRELADAKKVNELIDSLTQQIARDLVNATSEHNAPWAIIGIKSHGDILARRLAARLAPTHLGSLDITLYRDDLSEIGSHPVVRATDVDFSVDGLNIVLVDDVFMTGRSVRAALSALMDLGRPKRVWLSVLVDRGGREFPIRPDHTALDISQTGASSQLRTQHELPGPTDRVEVRLTPNDETDAIVVRPSSKVGAIR